MLESLDQESFDESTAISISVRKQLKTFGGWCRALGIIFLFGGFGGIYSLWFVIYESQRYEWSNKSEYVVAGFFIVLGATICLLIGINLNRFGKKLRKLNDFTDENFSKSLKNGSNAMGITSIVVGIFCALFIAMMMAGTYFTIERIMRVY